MFMCNLEQTEIGEDPDQLPRTYVKLLNDLTQKPRQKSIVLERDHHALLGRFRAAFRGPECP